jgi:DNA-binding transcriptional LysR family regulator
VRILRARFGLDGDPQTLREVGAAFGTSDERVRQQGCLAGVALASSGRSPVLRIGCLPHLPIQRLLAFLGALGVREPQIETRVLHTPTVDQLRRLDGGELDVAIVHDAGERLDVETEPVFPGEEIAAFLTLGHALTGKQVLEPTDFLDIDLVTFPRTAEPALYDQLLGYVDVGSYRFRGVVEASGPHVRDVLLEVARGRGVALDSSSLAELSDARGLVVHRRLDPPLTMPDTVLAWAADRPPHHLIPVVRDVARDLRHDG